MSFQFRLNNKTAYQKIEVERHKEPGVWVCPLSHQKFCGNCQIKNCHANIKDNHHDSGCIYLFYDNTKKEFDKFDIIYALGLKEKSYRNLYKAGSNQATNIISLYRILQYLKTVQRSSSCKNCGIATNDFICSDTQACNQRRQILTQVIERSYLRFPEFKATVKDLVLLLSRLSEIKQYLDKIDQSHIELHELFGLSKDIFDKLKHIPLTEPKKEKE